jgi:NAD(P)-dependent dehydrogenase (short-subunit alcohol dehydrogenase family)
MAVVLITGCGSGIGRVTAQRLAELGHNVHAGVRHGDQAPPGRARAVGSLTYVPLDVTDPAQAQRAVTDVLAEFGRIDALVNNAGSSMFAALEETSDDDLRAIFETNTVGSLRLARLVLPAMRAQGTGTIINISSLAGFAPRPYLGAYAASKSALEALSFCLAAEVREFGVRVVVVSPGSFKTGSHHKRRPPGVDCGVERYRAVLAAKKRESVEFKVGRDPIEVANVIADCIASAAPPARVFVGADAERLAAERRSLADDEYVDRLATAIGAYGPGPPMPALPRRRPGINALRPWNLQ